MGFHNQGLPRRANLPPTIPDQQVSLHSRSIISRSAPCDVFLRSFSGSAPPVDIIRMHNYIWGIIDSLGNPP